MAGLPAFFLPLRQNGKKSTHGGARKGAGRKRENKHHIGFRVSDETFKKIETQRGKKPRNAFLRDIIETFLK